MGPVKAYKYLFYRGYQWQKGMFGTNDAAEYTAAIGNSLVIFLNLMTVFVGYQSVTGSRLEWTKWNSIFAILIVYLVNYFYLLHNGRAHRISDEFSSETEQQKRYRTYGCLIYILISYLVFMILIVNLHGY